MLKDNECYTCLLDSIVNCRQKILFTNMLDKCKYWWIIKLDAPDDGSSNDKSNESYED